MTLNLNLAVTNFHVYDALYYKLCIICNLCITTLLLLFPNTYDISPSYSFYCVVGGKNSKIQMAYKRELF